MATYAFTLQGCNQENAPSVKAATSQIPEVTCKVVTSARGDYVLFTDSELAETEVRARINNSLKDLGVSVASQTRAEEF